MRPSRVPLLLAPLLLTVACEPAGHLLFSSPQSDPIVLSPDGLHLYVANTTSNSVSVIDTTSRSEIAEIAVGLEPVSLAARPDGLQLWVANHVSDSVSVIDTNAASPTFHTVIETVQDYEPLANGGATRFDEPVGVAFASNAKAYVALSSRNQIAVVDVASYQVTKTIDIPAQDPRAITVRNGRLFVLAFESGNQSELSACASATPAPQCTLDFQDLSQFATDPNLAGIPKNVVRDFDVPDRDLFVFDTANESPVGNPVTHVGTLLYDVVVDAAGNAFVANTDARNHHLDGNGLAAPPPAGQGLGLADLDNRLFRNRITRVACGGGACGAPTGWDLEPEPGLPVADGTQLATPYGLALSDDDAVLVMTAAGSSRIATIDPATGAVLARLDVGEIPRGVALRANGDGTHTAYVLNTLDNSISVVTVDGATGALSAVDTVADLGSDPTPDAVRRGRIAFNDADASSTGTFACASCHPDANVDQLVWVIGAQCADCSQEDPRTTMPVRGLRATLPLHWDGTLGDPFGGPNGEVGPGGNVAANCDPNDPHTCFAQLVDGSLSGVMCAQPGCPAGPSGKAGRLDAAARDDLARFLASVSYPPARSRPVDDVVSPSALAGFADFFLDQGGSGGGVANTCGDTTGGCHALPLGTSTNSPVVGAFDAPTWRGMTDRFVQFSMGITAPEEIQDLAGQFGAGFGVIPWNPAVGLDERTVFSVAFTIFNPVYNVFPDDLFQMFEEASTGFSGATGRQVSLNTRTTQGGLASETEALLVALEAADERGVVNLRGPALRGGVPMTLAYHQGSYRDAGDPEAFAISRQDVLDEAGAGTLTATLMADLPLYVGNEPAHPQPLVWPESDGGGPTGDPDLPVLPGDHPIRVRSEGVRTDARVLIDGQPAAATITCVGGSFDPFCSGGLLEIELASPPSQSGLHLLQVRTSYGMTSNELPICVAPVSSCL